MRAPAILLLGALLATTARAAEPVTVDRIQQILTASHGDSDAKLAKEISSLEATERIDTPTLAGWLASAPGDHTRQALTLLADSSAFLPLPPSRIVDRPPPDADSLGQIISHTINYLGTILHNLPNFMAVRDTTQFEDSPWDQETDNARSPNARQKILSLGSVNLVVGKPYFVPLYAASHQRTQVTYRDGHEVAVATSKKDEETGLRSRGEFGPVLAVVIGDAFRQKLYWDHWVEGAAGPLATLRYSVPQDASHYIVEYPSADGRERIFPAYHGEITIDPATGAVLRLTLIADMPSPFQAALVVEYGPVVLGDHTYICPLRAVFLSREPLAGETKTAAPALRTALNDVSFTDYHLFHAEVRILGHAKPDESSPEPH